MAPESNPQNVQTRVQSGQTVAVPRPEAGAEIAVTSSPAGVLDLAFDPAQATYSRVDNSLVFEVDGGGKVTITDFFAVGDESLPDLKIPAAEGEQDGQVVASTDFLDPNLIDMTTAAGPAGAPPSSGSDGSGDPLSMTDGIDRLGDQGTWFWGYASEPDEEAIGTHMPSGSFGFNITSGMGTEWFSLGLYEDALPEQHLYGDSKADPNDQWQAGRINCQPVLGDNTVIDQVVFRGFPEGTRVFLGDPANGGQEITSPGQSYSVTHEQIDGPGIWVIAPDNTDADFTMYVDVTIRSTISQNTSTLDPIAVNVIVDAVADLPVEIGNELVEGLQYSGIVEMQESTEENAKNLGDDYTLKDGQHFKDGFAVDSFAVTQEAQDKADLTLSFKVKASAIFSDYGENPGDASEEHFLLVEKPATAEGRAEWTCWDENNNQITDTILLWVDPAGSVVDQSLPAEDLAAAGYVQKEFFKVPADERIDAGTGAAEAQVTLKGEQSQSGAGDEYYGAVSEDGTISVITGGLAVESNLSDDELDYSNNLSANFGKDSVETKIDVIDSKLTVKAGWMYEDGDGTSHMRNPAAGHNAPAAIAGGTVDNGAGAPLFIAIGGGGSDEYISKVEFSYNGNGGTLVHDADGDLSTANVSIPSGTVFVLNGAGTHYESQAPNAGISIPKDALADGSLRFEPNVEHSADEVSIGYKVTVVDGDSGAAAEFSGNTVVVVDAVADLGTFKQIADAANDLIMGSGDGEGLVYGSGKQLAADYEGTHKSAVPGDTVAIKGNITFPDTTDGSETHYIVANIPSGWSVPGCDLVSRAGVVGSIEAVVGNHDAAESVYLTHNSGEPYMLLELKPQGAQAENYTSNGMWVEVTVAGDVVTYKFYDTEGGTQFAEAQQNTDSGETKFSFDVQAPTGGSDQGTVYVKGISVENDPEGLPHEYDYSNNVATTEAVSVGVKMDGATSGLGIKTNTAFEGNAANKHGGPEFVAQEVIKDAGKITLTHEKDPASNEDPAKERVNAVMLTPKNTGNHAGERVEGKIMVKDVYNQAIEIEAGGGLVFSTVTQSDGTILYTGAYVVDASGDVIGSLKPAGNTPMSFDDFMSNIDLRYVPENGSYSDVDVRVDMVASITDPVSGDTKLISSDSNWTPDPTGTSFGDKIAQGYDHVEGGTTFADNDANIVRDGTVSTGAGTVVVDAVADRPVVTAGSQVVYGTDENDAKYDAARPGDTVTLKGTTVAFKDNDGSEDHTILVQKSAENSKGVAGGDVTGIKITYQDADGATQTITVTVGTGGAIVTDPAGVAVSEVTLGGKTYYKVDTPDTVDSFTVEATVKTDSSATSGKDDAYSLKIGGYADEKATVTGGDQHTGKEGYEINNESSDLTSVGYNVAPVNGQLLFVAGKAYEGNDRNQHAGQGERTVADNSKGLQISITGNDSDNDEYIAKIYLQYDAKGEGSLMVGDVVIPSGTYITRGADGKYTCTGKDANGGDVTVTLTADQLANASGNVPGAIKYVPDADSDSDVDVPIGIAATIVDPDSGDTVISTNMDGLKAGTPDAASQAILDEMTRGSDDGKGGEQLKVVEAGDTDSTVLVDAVADKPTTTFVDSDKNGKIDAEYVGGDKAAQPGETVILKNISVQFGDYDPNDGSESHFLMVQRRDVDSTNSEWATKPCNTLADQNMVLKGMDANGQEHTLTLQIVGGKITGILLDGVDVSTTDAYKGYLVDVGSVNSLHHVNAVEGSNTDLKDTDSYNNSPTNAWNNNSGDYFKIPVPNEFLNMVDGKVTTDVAIDLPDTYKADDSFTLKVGGMALESSTSGSEFENLNNAAYDMKNAEVKVGFASKPEITLTENRIYENLTPNAHLTQEQLDAAHKMGVDVNAPNGVDAADAKSGPAVMKVTGLDSTDSAAMTLVFSAKTVGNQSVDFASDVPSDKFRVEVDLDGNGTIDLVKDVEFVNGQWQVDIPGLTEGAVINIYPGHNYNSSDIKVDYSITVTDGNSGHSKTWTTEAEPTDPTAVDPNTSYGENAKEIDVDAVAQRPGVGTIDANVGKPNTSTPDPDDHYSHAAPGDYASLRTQVTFSDYNDGSEQHYVLVQYEAGCTPEFVVINGVEYAIADVKVDPPQPFEGNMYYKIPVDNSVIANSTPPGTLDVEVKVKVDSSMNGTELRIGGMAHEPALPGQADTEWEVKNNTAIVVSDPATILVSGTEGLTVGSGWVFDHDRPNEHMNEHNGVMEGKEIVEGLAPDGVVNGTVITIGSAGNDILGDITFSAIPGGTLYQIPKNYSGGWSDDDLKDYAIKVGDKVTLDAESELRFIPNRGSDNLTDFNDKDPVLKFEVTVRDPQSGQEKPIEGSVTIKADAVAQAPSEVDGTDPADQDVHHGATVQIAVKASFEDLDGSEQHYILVEAHPNTSIASGAHYTVEGTYTHTHPDGTSVTYHKVLVDNEYLKANGGNADITVNYKTSGLDTPGDHEVRVGALSKEPDAGDGTEYTIHNNEAFADGGSVNIDFAHGGGGLWVGPVYENNTPNAHINDYNPEYGQIHVGTVPNGATSVTIKLPDGVTLVDKDGVAYTPGNGGSYTVDKDDFDDIYIKMPENFSDQDFTLDYGFNVPGGTDYVWQVDDSASSMILYFDGNKDESITFSGLGDSKNGGEWVQIGNGDWVFQITKTGGQSWSDILDDFSATRGGQPVTDGDYYFLAGQGTPSSPKDGELKEITQEPTVIGGSATVVVDAVAQQPVGLEEKASVDGVLGEQNSVTIAVQATFQDSVENVSETRHYVLVEKQPGFDIEGANTIFIEGKAYFQVDVTGKTPGPDGYEVELKLTDPSRGEGKVLLDTGALSVEIGADDDPGVLVGGADNDGDLEWRTDNNMGWKLNEKPCEVEISLVKSVISVSVSPVFEHGDGDTAASGVINITGLEPAGASGSDILTELTLKVDSGDLYYGDQKINPDGPASFQSADGKLNFSVDAGGKVTVTSVDPGKSVPTDGFSYKSTEYDSSDVALQWTARVTDPLSGDTKPFGGAPDIVVDAVAQAPDLSDIWAGGVEGQGAVQAGGDGKVSATLTFKDFAADEEHWAILAHDNEWTCDTVTIGGKTYAVETFHNEDGQAFYGVKITNDMVDPATGKVTVDFNITAPDNVDSDTPYTLRVGGVSFEADDGTAAGDKEIKLGNNWAEKVTPVTVTIGVATTDEAQLKDGLVINETGPAIVLSLTGAGGADLETILDNNGEIITNTQFTFTQDRAAGDNSVSVGQVIGKITYGDQEYDVVVTSITGGKTVAGVNIPTAGGFDFDEDFLLQLAGNYHNSNDITVNTVTTVKDASGDERTFPAAGDPANSSVIDVKSVANEGAIASIGNIALGDDPSFTVGAGNIVPGHAAEVSLGINGSFPDMDGSEQHYYFVQIPDGVEISSATSGAVNPADYPGCGLIAGNGAVYKLTEKEAAALKVKVTEDDFDQNDEVAVKVVAVSQEQSDYAAGGQYAYSDPGEAVIERGTVDFNLAPEAKGDGTVAGQLNSLRTDEVTGDLLDPEKVHDPDGDTGLKVASVNGTPLEGSGPWIITTGQGNRLTVYEDGTYKYERTNQTYEKGVETFTYTVKDPGGAESAALQLKVTVVDTNTPPKGVVSSQTGSIKPEYVGQLGFTDAEGDAVTLTSITVNNTTTAITEDSWSNNVLTVTGVYGALQITRGIGANGKPVYGYKYTTNADAVPGNTDVFTYKGVDAFDAPTNSDGKLTIKMETLVHSVEAGQTADGDGLPGWDAGAVINGAGGNLIHAGDGNDTITGGGPGQNTIYAGEGNDVIQAGNNAGDRIYAGHLDGQTGEYVADSGNNKITGGSGEDTIYGGLGNDTIDGGLGNDLIYGTAGNNSLSGGAGNDTIYGGTGNDDINGGDGNDVIYAGGAAGTTTTIHGDGGNDQIFAGLGTDILYGGSGEDTFIWLKDNFGGSDTIKDFSYQNNDRISFADIFPEAGGQDIFTETAPRSFAYDGGDTRIEATFFNNTTLQLEVTTDSGKQTITVESAQGSSFYDGSTVSQDLANDILQHIIKEYSGT